MTELSQVNIQKIEKEDLNKSALEALVNKLKTANVLVLGDLILDEYLLGSPERISREAPVIVLNYKDSKFALGGGANAANNIASYGAKTKLIGITGTDDGLLNLEKISSEQNIDLDTIQDAARTTTIKTRIISTSNSNADNGTLLKQQVLRVDRQSREPVSQEIEDKLFQKLKEQTKDTDMILLSDYSNGVFTESLAKRAIAYAKENDKTIVVDANDSFEKFFGAAILTPNQPDAEAMVGYQIKSDDDLVKAGQDLLKITDAKHILLTRGAKGMALFTKTEKAVDLKLIPAFNKSEVFDVTGAGDTVTGTLSAALSIGAEPLEAAILGNLAASIVVSKYGTATVSTQELLDLLFKL